MKKRLWQLHSWCGLFAGVALLLIGVSGSILVFRTEVDALLDPASNKFTSSPNSARLSFDELFAQVRVQFPDREVVGWQVARDPRAPDSAALQPRGDVGDHWRWIAIDPHTGQALGTPETAVRKKFTDWLLDLHVSMLLSDWGTVLNGLFAALLCVLGLSGLWLYREFWRTFLRLRWKASARIFFSDLHKTVGISSVAFNLILGFTGAWWNLPSVRTVFGFDSAPTVPKSSAVRFYNPALSIDTLIALARRTLPELDTTHVYLNLPPRYAAISVQALLPTRNPFRSDNGGEVTFDPETGALKTVRDIRRAPLWTQIEDMMTPLHFGTFGGLPIKLLWCLGGLTPGMLGVSGFLIWRSRSLVSRTPGALRGRSNSEHNGCKAEQAEISTQGDATLL